MNPLFWLVFAAASLAPDSPDRAFRQPQLAADSQRVVMTFGSGDGVYFAASEDGGRTFSRPVKVAEEGHLALGRHRGPRISITPQAIVVSAIVGQKGGGADGDLLAWRSTDGGKTWSAGARVNDVPAAAREGLHAMAAGRGVLFAAWLDLRSKGTKLYGAYSNDGGATWSKNVRVYESPEGTICQCCHPSLLVDGEGKIHAMWRNVMAGSRDMYVARSADGGRSFGPAERLGEGTWPLNACPMDGGGLAVDRDGKLATVWRRGTEVFLARIGEAERKLEAGKDPAIASGAGGTYALWNSGAAVHASLPGKGTAVELAAEGSFPAIAASPGGPVVAAWEEKGRIEVRRLD